MNATNDQRFHELQDVVAQLGNVLAASERRATRLERRLRLGAAGLALLCIIMLVWTIRPFGEAVAQQQMTASRSAEEALDRLTQGLTGRQSALGMAGQMLGGMLYSMQERAKKELPLIVGFTAEQCGPKRDLTPEQKDARIHYPLGYTARCHFIVNGIDHPTDEHYQQAVMAAIAGAAVDTGVLLARLHEDSNKIRDFVSKNVGTSNELLTAIGAQLYQLNITLKAVPNMEAHMRAMTNQMGIMASDMGSMRHSMGSTMGRMGNWMPW